eukprot:696084-Amphidinium_carterae.1
MTVTIPEKKVEEIATLLDDVLRKSVIQKTVILSLAGKLGFAAGACGTQTFYHAVMGSNSWGPR